MHQSSKTLFIFSMTVFILLSLFNAMVQGVSVESSNATVEFLKKYYKLAPERYLNQSGNLEPDYYTCDPDNVWYGVECDTINGDVEELKFFGSQFRFKMPYIPTEIGLLTELKYLYITLDVKSGTIPTEIGNLRKLKNFSVRLSDLGGMIPTEIGSLDNLEYFNIAICNLNGIIPTQIGLMSKLENFQIRETDISGIIPTQISQLQNIHVMILSDNSLSGTIPHDFVFNETENRVSLDVSNNYNLHGTIPQSLLYISVENLYELSLTNTNICGSIPESWSEKIYMNDPRIMDDPKIILDNTFIQWHNASWMGFNETSDIECENGMVETLTFRGWYCKYPNQSCVDLCVIGGNETNECDTIQGSTCNSDLGHKKCVCENGFTVNENNTQCADIDECQNQLFECKENEYCSNTRGSYECIEEISSKIETSRSFSYQSDTSQNDVSRSNSMSDNSVYSESSEVSSTISETISSTSKNSKETIQDDSEKASSFISLDKEIIVSSDIHIHSLESLKRLKRITFKIRNGNVPKIIIDQQLKHAMNLSQLDIILELEDGYIPLDGEEVELFELFNYSHGEFKSIQVKNSGCEQIQIQAQYETNHVNAMFIVDENCQLGNFSILLKFSTVFYWILICMLDL